MELLSRIAAEEPTPAALVKTGVPRDLATIAQKCLHKQPEKRYATAALLADDVERWLRGEPITARPVSAAERAWRWCRRKPALAALLALSVAATAAFVIQTRLANARLAGETATAETQAKLAYEAETRAMASRAEARMSAYVSNMLLASRARLSGEYTLARRILAEQPEDLRGLEWQLLQAVCTEAPPLLTITASGPVKSLTVSPDTRYVLGTDDTGVHAWDLRDGRRVDGILPDEDWLVQSTQVLSDPAGHWLAFATSSAGTHVYSWTAGTNGPANESTPHPPGWMPQPPAPAGARLVPDDAGGIPALRPLAVLPCDYASLAVSSDGRRLLRAEQPRGGSQGGIGSHGQSLRNCDMASGVDAAAVRSFRCSQSRRHACGGHFHPRAVRHVCAGYRQWPPCLQDQWCRRGAARL